MGRRFLAGVLLGPSAAVGVIVGRWLTIEPYSPLLIPYDLAAFALVFGAVALVAAGADDTTRGGRARSLLPSITILAVYGWLWAASPLGRGGLVLEAACGAILAGAALVLGRRIWRGPPPRDPMTSAVWLVGLAFALGLAGYEHGKVMAFLFPLAAVITALVGPRPAPGSLSRPLVGAALAGGVVLLCLGWRQPFSGERMEARYGGGERSGTSLLLIVLDTLRRDHVSLYGYGRPTTPYLDAWAEEGVIFERATANSSWTLPTHASLFTGLPSRTHGAHGRRERSGAYGTTRPLGRGFVTLAELADRAGYATGVIAANHAYLAERFGLDRGFQTYKVLRPREGLRVGPIDRLAERLQPWRVEGFRWTYYRAERVVDYAIDWLDGVDGRAFFLFLNFMDVHRPNRRPSTGAVRAANDVEAEIRRVRDAVLAGEPLEEGLRQELIEQYDRELAVLDRELGRLLDHLETSGLARRTTVVITSDHGEYLGEHALVGHSKHLHREVLDIPLIVRGPDIEPRRLKSPVQLHDLFAFAVELLELQLPGDTDAISPFSGERRQMVAEWYASDNAGFLDPRFDGRFDRDLRTLEEDGYKLFEDSRGRVELYDLASDPGEEHDLAAERPERLETLRARLREWVESTPEARPPDEEDLPIDRERLEQLRALGYAD